jgi:peptidoglycan/LPS O-acetylase OafA/YrhL
VLFGLGAVGVVAVLLAYFLGSGNAPLWTTLLASLGPLGLAIALLGLLHGARTNRRSAKRAARTERRAR